MSNPSFTSFPTDDESREARVTFERWLRTYGFPGTTHDAINLLTRMASTLAPKVAESALDSGNTDIRPEAGRKADAWDAVAIAHALNALTV